MKTFFSLLKLLLQVLYRNRTLVIRCFIRLIVRVRGAGFWYRLDGILSWFGFGFNGARSWLWSEQMIPRVCQLHCFKPKCVLYSM